MAGFYCHRGRRGYARSSVLARSSCVLVSSFAKGRGTDRADHLCRCAFNRTGPCSSACGMRAVLRPFGEWTLLPGSKTNLGIRHQRRARIRYGERGLGSVRAFKDNDQRLKVRSAVGKTFGAVVALGVQGSDRPSPLRAAIRRRQQKRSATRRSPWGTAGSSRRSVRRIRYRLHGCERGRLVRVRCEQLRNFPLAEYWRRGSNARISYGVEYRPFPRQAKQ